jgi:hypothetical protein
MGLEILNLIQAISVMNHLSVHVDTAMLKGPLGLPVPQYILKTLQTNYQYTSVCITKQIAKRLDATLAFKMPSK